MSSIFALGSAMETHTSTPEWKTFETRMRQRHLERCLVQAAAALDLGELDMARTALDEARVLSPEDPEVDALSGRLASSFFVSPRPAKCLSRSAAAIIAFLGVGFGWGAVWASTTAGGAMLTNLAGTAMTIAGHLWRLATIAGVPQSV